MEDALSNPRCLFSLTSRKTERHAINYPAATQAQIITIKRESLTMHFLTSFLVCVLLLACTLFFLYYEKLPRPMNDLI